MGTTTSLPAGIEIFRPGRHVDDQGVVREFTAADIAAIAAAYDPKLREAPLTIGHPAHDRPAWGWTARLGVNAAGRLTMDTHQVQPAFAEMVEGKRFKKRSSAFYPPDHPNNPKPGVWYLRHVAFLGAQPPAIAGLADFAETSDESGLVFFSEGDVPSPQEQNDMTQEAKDAVARATQAEAEAQAARDEAVAAKAAQKAAEDQLAQYAEQQRQTRHAGHVAFAEGEVKAGRLLPKDKGHAVAVLDLLADSQPVEFSEGDTKKKFAPAEWLKGLIAAAKPAVNFGEFAPGNDGSAQDDGRTADQLTDAELDARAKAYAAKHAVSYADALNKITTFTAAA